MKHVVLVVMLAIVGFAVAFAMSIAGRLSQEQVAMLVGLVCGAGVAAPLGIAIGWVMSHRQRERQATSPPSIIYMATPPASAAQLTVPAAKWPPSLEPPALTVPRRSFNVIGNNDFEEETESG
jgi:hypothetical protein